MRRMRLAGAIALGTIGAIAISATAWAVYTDTERLNPPPGESAQVNLYTYQCGGRGHIWEHADEAMTYEFSPNQCSYVRVRGYYRSASGSWSGWSSWQKDGTYADFATSGELTMSEHSVTN